LAGGSGIKTGTTSGTSKGSGVMMAKKTGSLADGVFERLSGMWRWLSGMWRWLVEDERIGWDSAKTNPISTSSSSTFSSSSFSSSCFCSALYVSRQLTLD